MSAREFFETLVANVEPDDIAGVAHSYLFDIQGEGRWLVDVRDGTVTVTEGASGEDADVEFKTSSETFDKILSRRQSPTTAYLTGKLKIDGDVGAALELQKLF
jgi:putative sterol carrier protein